MAEEVRNGDDEELVSDMSDIDDMSDSPPTDSNSHASNENSNGGEKCSEIFGNGMNNVNNSNVRHEEYMEVDEVSLNKKNSLEVGASNDILLDSAVQYIAEERADQVFKSTESGNRFISGFSRMENQNEEQNAILENLDLDYFFSGIERLSNVLHIHHIPHMLNIDFIMNEVEKYIKKTSKEKDENTSEENGGNTSEVNVGNTSEENDGNTSEKSSGNISEVNVGNTSEENGGNTSGENDGNTSEKSIINTKKSNTLSLDIANEDNSKKLLIQAWKPLSKLAQNALNSFKFEDGKVKLIKIPLGLEVYKCTKNCFYFCRKSHSISFGPCAFDGRTSALSSTSNDANVPNQTEICNDFLSLVKTTYKDYPNVYDAFLNTLMNYYILRFTESDVVAIATDLFAGNSQLLQKFYNFLDKKNKLFEHTEGQNGSHSLQNATYKIISGIPPAVCASQDPLCKFTYPFMYPVDIKCLKEGKLVNDSIIDFYLMYLHNEVLMDFMKPKVHVINTFFFTKFNTIFARQARDFSATVKSVQSWSKNIDLFSFKYLMIPVNISNHWVLVIIHLKCKGTTLSYDMFFFDSILYRKVEYNYRSCIVGILHSFLCIRWSLIHMTVGNIPAFKDTFLKILNVPQQVNNTDCGVYVLQYAEDFCKLFLPQATDLFSFTPQDMVQKRYFLKQLVLYIQNKEDV